MKLTTFTSSKSQATDYYRSIGPFTRLALQKKFEHTICPQERAQWHDIYNTDIVLIQRPNSTASLGIMADAKRMGKKVIIDFDDHLLEVPEDNPANHYFANPQVQKQIQDTFLFADAVIVSTKKLYDLYYPMCQGKIPMFIIPNGWNPTDLPMFEVKERHTPTRFVWRGGSTHFADLHTIKPEINQMIEMDTEVTFFGLNKFMMYDLSKKAINVDWSSMFVYFTFVYHIYVSSQSPGIFGSVLGVGPPAKNRTRKRFFISNGQKPYLPYPTHRPYQLLVLKLNILMNSSLTKSIDGGR